MRIVLVGGSGYVGSKLAARLLADKHDVQNVSRTGKSAASAPGFTYGHMQRLFDGADVVVNLAGCNIGEKRWTAARMQEIVSSRLDATKQIVETIHSVDSKPALLSMSAVGYYGHTLVPSNEAMAHGNSFLGELCYAWEQAALAASSVTRVAIARMGVILDRQEGLLQRMATPMNLGIGGTLGRGTQYLPWIHTKDAIDALAWLVAQPDAYGPYNVVAPEAVTWKSFATSLGRAMHRPAFVRIPEFPLRLAIGRRADIVVDGQYVVPQRLLNDAFSFSFGSLREALSDLYS